MATKPKRTDVSAAASAVQVFVLLNDATGASEAQGVVAEEQGTRLGLRPAGALPLRRRQDQGRRRGGQEGGRRGRALAGKQVQKTVDSYREQAIKFQQQLEQQQEQGGSEAGEQQLEDPFGDLGGGTAPVTPTP